MITEDQVRKAASRYRRWKLGDFPSPYKSPYFNCDGDDPAYIDRDRRTLADAYIAELSRRESERVERAARIANIEKNLNTRAEWTLEDYQDFYERDVVFLLNVLNARKPD